jgi:3-hydroxybutyryl-CoA dehydrogenase
MSLIEPLASHSKAQVARPQTVGIVGAGVMGRGLTEDLISHGFDVRLVDPSQMALNDARTSVRRSLLSARLRGPPAEGGLGASLERLSLHQDLAALDTVDFVIENAVEDWATKQEIYAQLDAVCRKGVVIAANTSTFPIRNFAALLARPDRVLGMHFMNPVPAKSLVEVIPGPVTSAAAIEVAEALLEGLGKEMIVVGDGPGFVSNRVLMLTIGEAIRVVEDGVAEPVEVDRLFCGCFGHPMGPLATGDLIGLDTILLSLDSLRNLTGDPKFDACDLLRTMVADGRLGRKSGAGFFQYV